VLYRDDLVTAFWDAHPAASTHILIVPNRHIESLNTLLPGDEILAGHLLLVARELARAENIQATGYSLTINTGLDAGQTVFHLHLHLKSCVKY
jgi:histidine triad (HIT) family protein